MFRTCLLALLSLVVAHVAATAEDFAPVALPAAGTLPFGASPLATVGLANDTARTVTMEHLPPAPGLPPGGAVRVALAGMASPGSMPWNVQLNVRGGAAVPKQATLYIEFWMKTESALAETGEGLARVVWEENHAPYAKSIEREVTAPSDGSWIRVAAAGSARSDYAANGSQVNLTLNSARSQTILIGGLKIVALDRSVALTALPLPKLTYPGREADAPWRAAAQQRIAQLRMGDLTVQVRDAAGKPLAGVPVAVDMLRHAFPFGTAVDAGWLVAPGPDGDRYRAWVRDNCSIVVLENNLKWQGWEWGFEAEKNPGNRPENWRRTRSTTLQALAWLNDQGIAIKGHNLVWPGWSYLPKRLKPFASDGAKLASETDAHIVDILNATKPYRLAEWDVVNENYANHDLNDIIGPDALAGWFRLASQHVPPGCRLFYNDYAHLRRDPGGEFRAFVEELVLQLKRAGAPLHGLGIQSHFGSSLPGPAQVIAELDGLQAKLAVDLAITEFDVDAAGQEELQADFTRDYLTACFAAPGVTDFLMWGFWEGAHWLPNAALIRKDWSAKPNARAWADLIKGAWWTRARVVTDASGSVHLRGFKGLHRVSATIGGKEVAVEATIGDQAAEAVLTAAP